MAKVKNTVEIPDIDIDEAKQETKKKATKKLKASGKTEEKREPEKPREPSKFEVFIKSYLDKKAEKDGEFAENYKKEGKTVEKCCAHVITQMMEQAMDVMNKGRVAVDCGMDKDLDKSDVIKFAIEYWEKDDLEIDALPQKTAETIVENMPINVPDIELDMFE